MLLNYASFNKPPKPAPQSKSKARLVIFSSRRKPKLGASKAYSGEQLSDFLAGKTNSLLENTARGCTLYLCPRPSETEVKSHGGLLSPSLYSRFRDETGQGIRTLLSRKIGELVLEWDELDQEELLGTLVGLELASYNFRPEKASLPRLKIPKGIDQEILSEARALAEGSQAARHLINLPPNILNPKTFAELIQKTFTKKKGWTCEVWNEERLKKEKMNLHVAVGAGAEERSRLVMLRYQGRKPEAKIALVGKGITFDSGGLDIKPSAGMRLMKKDMGGAAAVFGLALWVLERKPNLELEFYFPLAENAVDEDSFRPGDIYTARNGKTVEISNTDAEGRLVLADSLALASERLGNKLGPKDHIINVATLTGAGKIALGPDIASLFSNTDSLAASLMSSGQERGDACWQLPLWPQYRSYLKSSFADLENSASTSYGAVITAALFLEDFVGQKPWAHLDIYAWKDGAGGVFAEKGGCGQAVQMLAMHLNSLPDL